MRARLAWWFGGFRFRTTALGWELVIEEGPGGLLIETSRLADAGDTDSPGAAPFGFTSRT